MMARMFAACLIAAPAAAATLPYTDLVMVAGPDGRPMFRPDDGVDVYPGKYTATQRPKRRPCEPLPVCLHGMTYAPLPLSLADHAAPQAAVPVWQSTWTAQGGHTTGGGATGGWDEPPAPVPLPATVGMLLAALMGLGIWKRGRT